MYLKLGERERVTFMSKPILYTEMNEVVVLRDLQTKREEDVDYLLNDMLSAIDTGAFCNLTTVEN